jgi:PAS domain S-box-containing protein
MATAVDSSPNSRANILLVDDDPGSLLALEAILDSLGQNLVRAYSGEEALRRVVTTDFAVVLLDVQMQGLDGFQTAQWIRAQERKRPTPIIFLTAYESPDFPVLQAYRLGAVDYLVKPLVPEIVRAKVAGFVELSEAATHAERQAEQLRLSEERYRILVEQVQDYAIFLLDPDGHVLTWNVGAERMKGYRAEDVIGRHFSLFFTREEAAAGKPQRALQIAAEKGRYECESWRVRKDGSRFWANLIFTALHDSEGRLRGFTEVTRDLTQQLQAEEQARQLVRAESARVAAEERVQARDRFLSIASHELRTPLNPLLINIQTLLRAARDGSLHDRFKSRVPGILETCQRQVRLFAKLVNDLLDVSRIAEGQLELQRDEVDLAALVREVAAQFGPESELAGCAVELHADVPVVGAWDRTRLEQVATNLLSNAMKYGRGKPIEITVEADARAARLTVRDHGIGIAPEDQERIFERFERAVSGHEYGGLGIGLYIVRQIVTALGGSVRVASRLGEGASFTVTLPNSVAQTSPSEPRPSASGATVAP